MSEIELANMSLQAAFFYSQNGRPTKLSSFGQIPVPLSDIVKLRFRTSSLITTSVAQASIAKIQTCQNQSREKSRIQTYNFE